MRNTRCTLLLLVLTGGRVMGSYDQMTLLQAVGQRWKRVDGLGCMTDRVAKWFPPFRLA